MEVLANAAPFLDGTGLSVHSGIHGGVQELITPPTETKGQLDSFLGHNVL